MRLSQCLSFVVAAAAVVAWPCDARADFDFQLAFGAGVRGLRTMPTLSAPSISTSARDLAGGPVAMRGGLGMIGGYADTDLTIDDRWIVPLFGAGIYGALGSYDALITSRDGSIVRARKWTSESVELLLPGIGYRVKRRRWMFETALRLGAGWFKMEGVVASGADQDTVDLQAGTLIVQLEVEGCRRLDPTTRVCLQVAPRMYDYGVANGGIVGLRVEWGR